MVLGILPVVGLPLPLLSYGGTAVLTNFLIFGFVLGISMRKFIFKGVDKLVIIFAISIIFQLISFNQSIAEEVKIRRKSKKMSLIVFGQKVIFLITILMKTCLMIFQKF